MARSPIRVLFDEVFAELGLQEELLAPAADDLQTTRAVLNGTGDMVQSIEYDSFGVISAMHDGSGQLLHEYYFGGPPAGRPNTSLLATAVAIAGRVWDNVALYKKRTRWYEPESGRFIGEDPAQDGKNWYAYAGNDPVNFRDPTGLSQAGNPTSGIASRLCNRSPSR